MLFNHYMFTFDGSPCEINDGAHFSCSMFPRSTYETFADKLYQTFKNHKRFTKPKLSRSDFTICHYAGDVSLFFPL